MKLGIFCTLNLKGLFSGILLGLLLFSFVLMIAFGNTIESGETVNKNNEIEPIPTVIIDAGHGGEDGGTVSSKGINEKLINLQISEKIQALLILNGYSTLMTRTDDRLIYDSSAVSIRDKKVSDLRNRLKLAEANPDGIFLSIHQNYFRESKYWGTQVFYSVNNPESKIIAESIQNSTKNKIQLNNNRKIKQSGKEIFLLNNIKTPAVMVECGFMSNYSEALLLEDFSYQLKMSLSIIDGINNYLDTKGVI